MTYRRKIQNLRREAIVYHLDGMRFMLCFTVDESAAAYNGIGAEWMPADLRDKITEWLTIFEPAALIHDLRYSASDGTRKSFNAANMEFRDNCLKIAGAVYPWYSWRRWRARAVAKLLYKCVASDGGWTAWTDAAKALTKTKKGEK